MDPYPESITYLLGGCLSSAADTVRLLILWGFGTLGMAIWGYFLVHAWRNTRMLRSSLKVQREFQRRWHASADWSAQDRREYSAWPHAPIDDVDC